MLKQYEIVSFQLQSLGLLCNGGIGNWISSALTQATLRVEKVVHEGVMCF